MRRVIGEYIGKEKGPLLVVIGAMHGNEPAGVKAIDLLLKMLEVEPIKNPNFIYKGAMIGLVGNLAAFEKEARFINKDLNRCWTKEFIESKDVIGFSEEKKELSEILSVIKKAVAKHQPNELIILDLHTTSSDGGIFNIVGDDANSLDIAREMYAPVVLGMLDGLTGTTLHYFSEETFGIKTSTITFESGQHTDPLSTNRAIAGIVNCMRTIGSVLPTDVESQHDKILLQYSLGLPSVSRLLYSHRISNGEEFRMKPGYKNFQKVKEGELLAHKNDEEIHCLKDGLILMPLYQRQGDDGFFIIKQIDEN